MFLHRVLEFTAGGVFLIVIPLWVEQLIKFSKPCFVYSDTGYGTLFIIYILALPLLERLTGTRGQSSGTASAPAVSGLISKSGSGHKARTQPIHA